MTWHESIKNPEGKSKRHHDVSVKSKLSNTLRSPIPSPKKPKLSPIVYHGTFSDFEKFDKNMLGTNTSAPSAFEGFFFASNKKVAESYASNLTKRLKSGGDSYSNVMDELKKITGDSYVTILNKYRLEQYDKETDEKVGKLLQIIQDYEDLDAGVQDMPMAYDNELDESGKLKKSRLLIQNPLIHDMKGDEYREISYKELIKRAKSEGHDGVIIKNTYDGGNIVGNLELTDIYVVFDESQIRMVK